MAQDSIMGNLFGVSPAIYEQNKEEATRKQALEFSKLDPYERTNAMAFIGGRGLGNIVGGALGAQDPVMMMLSQRAELGQQFDLSTPTGFKSLAKELLVKNDPQGAQIALQKGSELELRESQIAKNLSEKMTNEQRNALNYASTIAPQGTPEFNEAYKTKFNELTSKTDATSKEIQIAAAIAAANFTVGSPEYKERYKTELTRLTTKENKENINKVGVATGTRKAVFIDVNNDQLFVYQDGADGKQIRVPYSGGIDQLTSKNEAQRIQTKFEELLDKKDADRVDAAMTLRDNSITALNSLKRLNELDQSALVGGAFASNRVGFLNFLNTLGLTSDKDQNNLAKSENYQKTAGDVILATLGGKLGAGFSNEDRRFIESLVPQLENSPQARKQLIEFMVKKNQTIVNETTRLENFARDNKTLKGFVPTIPIVLLQPVTNANRLSEIDAEIARKQAQKGAK